MTEATEGEFRRASARLLVSRSPGRTQAFDLEGAVLDAENTYAMFLTGGPWLQVDFKLDDDAVHHEEGAPWDSSGTAVDGTANRVSLTAGAHVLRVDVTDVDGTFTLTVPFDVEQNSGAPLAVGEQVT